MRRAQDATRLAWGTHRPAASFPADVEEEANTYFQKIYTNQLSIEDTVALLLRFKNSANQREQEVFACMIHNLFDEYRFFGRYPDKELMITGILFGSLIQNQLVSYIPLGIALRYVLEGNEQGHARARGACARTRAMASCQWASESAVVPR